MKKAIKRGAEPLKKALVKKVVGKKVGARKVLTVKAVGVKKGAAPREAADAAVLDRLYGVIMQRRTADPARSHSARLLSRGPAKVAQKFGEEAVECLIEAVAQNRTALVAESADVLYHLVVLWVAAGVSPQEVWSELHRREGISGVVEKAARLDPLIGTTKIP